MVMRTHDIDVATALAGQDAAREGWDPLPEPHLGWGREVPWDPTGACDSGWLWCGANERGAIPVVSFTWRDR